MDIPEYYTGRSRESAHITWTPVIIFITFLPAHTFCADGRHLSPIIVTIFWRCPGYYRTEFLYRYQLENRRDKPSRDGTDHHYDHYN